MSTLSIQLARFASAPSSAPVTPAQPMPGLSEASPDAEQLHVAAGDADSPLVSPTITCRHSGLAGELHGLISVLNIELRGLSPDDAAKIVKQTTDSCYVHLRARVGGSDPQEYQPLGASVRAIDFAAQHAGQPADADGLATAAAASESASESDAANGDADVAEYDHLRDELVEEEQHPEDQVLLSPPPCLSPARRRPTPLAAPDLTRHRPPSRGAVERRRVRARVAVRLADRAAPGLRAPAAPAGSAAAAAAAAAGRRGGGAALAHAAPERAAQ